MQSREFHITVSSIPISVGYGQASEAYLRYDLHLAKAAMLYADNVKIYSPSLSLILNHPNLNDLTIEDKVALIDSFKIYISDNPILMGQLEHFLELYKKPKLNMRDRRQKRDMEKLLKKSFNFKPYFKEYVINAGGKGIDRAIELELLQIHNYSTPMDVRTNYEDEGIMTSLFKEHFIDMAMAVMDGTTYPLFDQPTNAYFSEILEAVDLPISEIDIKRTKNVGLASSLLDRLPVLSHSTVDEIIDIRKEMQSPLVRFRSAMNEYSEKIRSAIWNADFPKEAEEVFHNDISPAVLEIEEQFKTTKALSNLLPKTAREIATMTALPAIAVTLSKVSSLPDLYSFVIGSIALAAGVSLSAVSDIIKNVQDAKQNQLYFYYKLQKKTE